MSLFGDTLYFSSCLLSPYHLFFRRCIVRGRCRVSHIETVLALLSLWAQGSQVWQRSVHCTVYSLQCTLYTVQSTLITVNCTLYTVHCTLYSEHCTLSIVHCILYNIYCTLCTVQYGLYTVNCIPIHVGKIHYKYTRDILFNNISITCR